jgi:hypothetical protein
VIFIGALIARKDGARSQIAISIEVEANELNS